MLSVCLSVCLSPAPFFSSSFPAPWNKLTTYKEEKTELRSLRLFFYTLEAFPIIFQREGKLCWLHFDHSFTTPKDITLFFISLKRSQLPVEDLMDVLSVFVHIFLPQTTATHHPHPDLNPNNTPDVPTSQHVPPCRYCNALDIFLDVCFVSKQGVANQELFIVVALNSVCTCLSTTQAKCFLTYSTSPGRQAGRQASRHDYFVFCPF